MAYLDHYNIKYKVKRNGAVILYVLDQCIFDPNHGPGESAIGQKDSGKIFYQCFHNSCKGQTWHDARQIISGQNSLKSFMADPLDTDRMATEGTWETQNRSDYESEERRAIIDEGKSQQKSKPQAKGPRLLNLDDLQEGFTQDIIWLYKKHIPWGMPVIFNGREGQGKTTDCIQIANEILMVHRDGIIIWIASEGFVQDTKNKMDRLGSDRSRLLLIQNADETFQFNFSLQSDRKQLDDAMAGRNVLAVFIDSIRGISPFDDNDSKIKNVMMNVNAIVCDKHRASLIYIDHHKKGSAATILDQSVGTTAKTAAVRRVFSVVPVSTYVRKIVCAKSNILGEIPCDLIAALSDDKLFIYEANEQSESSMIGQAEQWLIEIFSKHKTYKCTDVYDMGKQYGLSSDVLKKAKQHLNINSWQEAFGKPWYWTCKTFMGEVNPSI